MTLSIVAAPPHHGLVPPPVVLIPTRQVPHADRAVATGELVRVRRGVVAAAAAWHALPPWERYLARVYAVLLMHPDVVLSHESSAALRGWPVFGDPVIVHVLDDGLGSSRATGGIRTHTTRSDRLIDEIDGIRLVGAVDTVVDLARGRHRAVGLSVADAALRAEASITPAVLVAANESRVDSRGRRQARWVTHRATPLAETVLETMSRAAVEWLGFDDPVLQHTVVTDGRRDRTDMWWEGARVAGEADGDIKYDGSLQPSAAAIRDEKARDRRILRHASGIAHWGWQDVVQVDPLRTELRRAGLRVRHPEESRELQALRTLAGPHPRPRP